MSNNDLIIKKVVLTPEVDQIINYRVKSHSLGERGYSAALRMIVLEWGQEHMPNPESEPTQELTIERLR